MEEYSADEREGVLARNVAFISRQHSVVSGGFSPDRHGEIVLGREFSRAWQPGGLPTWRLKAALKVLAEP